MELSNSFTQIEKHAVEKFTSTMRFKLNKNAHKGGWKDCELEYLLDRLLDEAKEFSDEIDKFKEGKNYSITKIREEAADVANFLMMISDHCETEWLARSDKTQTKEA